MHLTIPDCAGASGAEIAKLVALELVPRFAIANVPPAALEASLECEAERALIRVRDAERDAVLELEVPLADTRPEARPRLLALAIAELIATSRLEPAAREEPKPEPKPEPAAAPSAPPASSEPHFEFGASAGVVRAYEPALWGPGARLDLAYSGGPVRLQADLDFSWAAHATDTAQLDGRAASLALAAGLRIWNGALAWDAGLGLRGGVAWLSAETQSSGVHGQTLSGVFLAPLVWSGLSLPLSAAWYARLSLELAYVVKPVRGLDLDGDVLLELSGLRFASWLGVGVAL